MLSDSDESAVGDSENEKEKAVEKSTSIVADSDAGDEPDVTAPGLVIHESPNGSPEDEMHSTVSMHSEDGNEAIDSTTSPTKSDEKVGELSFEKS